jgi:urease accessory protein
MTKAGALRLLPLTLLALATPAFAHPGHTTGFAGGMLHPMTGIDHLLAMLMVGLWSGLCLGRYRWTGPAAFVTFMLAGFTYGAAGGALPIAEGVILASLIGLGGLLIFEVKLPVAASAGLIGLFAIGHGFAHGSAMHGSGHDYAFATGLITTTILLHATGIGLSRFAGRRIGQGTGLFATVTAAALMWPA